MLVVDPHVLILIPFGRIKVLGETHLSALLWQDHYVAHIDAFTDPVYLRLSLSQHLVVGLRQRRNRNYMEGLHQVIDVHWQC